MNQDRAEGLLIAFAINQLLDSANPADPAEPEVVGCCRIHCGPCAALDWARVNNPQWARDAVLAAYPRGTWDWNTEDKDIDWPQLVGLWDAWPGCAKSNGVWERCEAEPDPDAAIDYDEANDQWVLICDDCGETGRVGGTADEHDALVRSWAAHAAEKHGGDGVVPHDMLINRDEELS